MPHYCVSQTYRFLLNRTVLQPLPSASGQEDTSITHSEQSAASPELAKNIQSQPVEGLTVFDEENEMEAIAEPTQPEISIQIQQLPTQEDDIQDSDDYSVVDVYEDFAINEAETIESEHCPHWSIAFASDQHLPILTHIEQYGCITEVEVIKMLGSARSARNFTCNIEQYSSILPFSIKIQTSLTGKRYSKNPH